MLSGSPLEIRKAKAPSCEVPKSFSLWLLHGRRYKLWSWFKKKKGTLKNVNLLLSCNAQLPRNLQQYPVTLALLSEHSHSGVSPYLERNVSEAELTAVFSFCFISMCSSAILPSQQNISKKSSPLTTLADQPPNSLFVYIAVPCGPSCHFTVLTRFWGFLCWLYSPAWCLQHRSRQPSCSTHSI